VDVCVVAVFTVVASVVSTVEILTAPRVGGGVGSRGRWSSFGLVASSGKVAFLTLREGIPSSLHSGGNHQANQL